MLLHKIFAKSPEGDFVVSIRVLLLVLLMGPLTVVTAQPHMQILQRAIPDTLCFGIAYVNYSIVSNYQGTDTLFVELPKQVEHSWWGWERKMYPYTGSTVRAIPPGGSAELSCSLRVHSVGNVQKSLLLKSNDPALPDTLLAFNYTVKHTGLIVFDEYVVDSGYVLEGEPLDFTFSFTNESEYPCRISSVKGSEPTAYMWTQGWIPPQGAGDVICSLYTWGRPGKQSQFIQVSLEGCANPIELTAVVDIVEKAYSPVRVKDGPMGN